MAALSRIKPLNRYRLQPRPLDEIGAAPDLVWLPLDRLRIDHTYQRQISARSVTVIRNAVETFDWAALKALTVIDRGDGTFEVIDGQHTAIAAATHGGIDRLPALVCSPRSQAEKARAFVQVNTSRLAMTPLQIFWGQVAAGDLESVAVAQGAKKAGARVLRSTPGNAAFKIGDTISVAALRRIARAKGKAGVARVLRLGLRCRLAPIGLTFVRAMELIIWGPAGSEGRPSDDELYALCRLRWRDIEARAEIHREAAGVPKYKAAAHVILEDWRAGRE